MAEIIKSFEEGAAVSGDILTGGKQKKKIKIGVLTCGYFEYWRMYPGLKEKVEGDLKRVTDRICGEYENVLLSGMVDTLDEADRAGKLFRRENVDAVLLVYGTYTADFITLTALDQIKEKPLIVFSTQPHKNVDRQGTYENSLRNSAIIGIAQITGTLCKLKRKYEVVVGSVDDENAYRKLRRHFKALQAIEDLREANIGIIGHVFRGMYDIELSKTFLKSAFGVNIILIQNSHLMEVWEKVEESEVEKEKAKLLSRFKRKNVSEEDVGNAVRLAVAMRKISEKFHLNAMCFLDQHFIQKQVKTSARIGASLLMENTDMCVNCEGDLGGLVAEMLLKSLSDKNPLMAEWGEYDEETNSVLLIGHGIGTPDLASSEKEVLLSRTPEEWGFEGSGLNYELVVKEGDYTISHIFETPEGYRLLISPVEGIEFPRLDFDEIHALVKVKSPVTQYLQKLLETGVSHHAVLGGGDVSEELKSVARFLNIDSFFIE